MAAALSVAVSGLSGLGTSAAIFTVTLLFCWVIFACHKTTVFHVEGSWCCVTGRADVTHCSAYTNVGIHFRRCLN